VIQERSSNWGSGERRSGRRGGGVRHRHRRSGACGGDGCSRPRDYFLPKYRTSMSPPASSPAFDFFLRRFFALPRADRLRLGLIAGFPDSPSPVRRGTQRSSFLLSPGALVFPSALLVVPCLVCVQAGGFGASPTPEGRHELLYVLIIRFDQSQGTYYVFRRSKPGWASEPF